MLIPPVYQRGWTLIISVAVHIFSFGFQSIKEDGR